MSCLLGICHPFNTTIDDMEEDCVELADTRLAPRRIQDRPFPSTSSASTRTPEAAREASPILKMPRRKGRRLNYTDEMNITVPDEPNHWTESKWKAALALFLKFIDDGFCVTKVNFENSYGFRVNRQLHRGKHAVQSQNVFRHVVRRAEDLGMVVNSRKTAMICTSGAAEYEEDAYLLDADNNRIGCGREIKALGLRLSLIHI